VPLTNTQAQLVSNAKLAIRAAPSPVSVSGAGYGLYTPNGAAQMIAWERTGPPADWYARLYNTGLFMLAMPHAQDQYVLFVPGAGDPQGESYSVTQLPGGQGSQTTLPKVNSLAGNLQVQAAMALRGATPQTISDWVIAQIK
jgi:hypothetical protein